MLLGCASPTPSGRGGAVLEYIPRAEHLRILEARLAAKEGDAQLELSGRVAQVGRRAGQTWRGGCRAVEPRRACFHCCAPHMHVPTVLTLSQAEREWQWKLEGKEQEVAGLTARARQVRARAPARRSAWRAARLARSHPAHPPHRNARASRLPTCAQQLESDVHLERQRAASAAAKAGDEAKRAAAQALELQRELEAAGREVTRLKARRGGREREGSRGGAVLALACPDGWPGHASACCAQPPASKTIWLRPAAGGAQGRAQRGR